MQINAVSTPSRYLYCLAFLLLAVSAGNKIVHRKERLFHAAENLCVILGQLSLA